MRNSHACNDEDKVTLLIETDQPIAVRQLLMVCKLDISWNIPGGNGHRVGGGKHSDSHRSTHRP